MKTKINAISSTGRTWITRYFYLWILRVIRKPERPIEQRCEVHFDSGVEIDSNVEAGDDGSVIVDDISEVPGSQLAEVSAVADGEKKGDELGRLPVSVSCD